MWHYNLCAKVGVSTSRYDVERLIETKTMGRELIFGNTAIDVR